MGMTHADFDKWIASYGEAWSTLDVDAIMGMLDPDNLVYYYDPFQEPKRTLDEVKAMWQPVPTNQKDVTFWHEIIFADNDKVLAHIKVTRILTRISHLAFHTSSQR